MIDQKIMLMTKNAIFYLVTYAPASSKTLLLAYPHIAQADLPPSNPRPEFLSQFVKVLLEMRKSNLIIEITMGSEQKISYVYITDVFAFRNQGSLVIEPYKQDPMHMKTLWISYYFLETNLKHNVYM